MKRTLFLIPIAWILAGCSAATPAINEYTIFPSPAMHAQPAAPLSSATLRIAATRVLPSLASKNLVYLHRNGEAGHYLYSRWSDTPAAMIERSLTSALQEQRVFRALLFTTSAAQSTYLLESDLNAFHHRFNPDGSSEGYIDATYRLIDPQSKQTLDSKRFQLSVQAATNDAAGGIDALSKATGELSAQCTLWLIHHLQETK